MERSESLGGGPFEAPSPSPCFASLAMTWRRGGAVLQSQASILPHDLQFNAEHAYHDDLLLNKLKNNQQPRLRPFRQSH